MSFEVGQEVAFKEPFKLHGDIPRMDININAGHKGTVVSVDDTGKCDVEIFEGFVINGLESELFVLPEEGFEKNMNETAKNFHKHFDKGVQDAMKKPGFHPWDKPDKKGVAEADIKK